MKVTIKPEIVPTPPRTVTLVMTEREARELRTLVGKIALDDNRRLHIPEPPASPTVATAVRRLVGDLWTILDTSGIAPLGVVE